MSVTPSKIAEVRQARDALRADLGRPPSLANIGERLGVSPEWIGQVLRTAGDATDEWRRTKADLRQTGQARESKARRQFGGFGGVSLHSLGRFRLPFEQTGARCRANACTQDATERVIVLVGGEVFVPQLCRDHAAHLDRELGA